jgi:hypothetical protein
MAFGTKNHKKLRQVLRPTERSATALRRYISDVGLTIPGGLVLGEELGYMTNLTCLYVPPHPTSPESSLWAVDNICCVGVHCAGRFGEVLAGAAGGSWVTLRARWVTLRARWVTLRARWVTLRARWLQLAAGQRCAFAPLTWHLGGWVGATGIYTRKCRVPRSSRWRSGTVCRGSQSCTCSTFRSRRPVTSQTQNIANCLVEKPFTPLFTPIKGL